MRTRLFQKFLLYLVPYLRRFFGIKVKNVSDTLNAVFNERKSLVRLGDGELRLLIEAGETGFQRKNPILRKKLLRLLDVSESASKGNVLVCLPGVISDRPREYGMKEEAKMFWFDFVFRNFWALKKLFNQCRELEFGDSCITRPFMDTQDRKYANEIFSRVKKELEGKNILVIEGKWTRFGVGNDLLSKVKSIRRIIGPEVNAFDRIDEIFKRTKEEIDVDVIILALGPAAKVLTYELSAAGFWCLDLGHLDVEYEWFRKNATQKIALTNKYVNESKEKIVKEECDDSVYEKEIIYICA